MQLIKLTYGGVLAALLMFALAATASAAPAPAAPAREVHVSFGELGAGPLDLHGLLSTANVDFGVRKDEVVDSAVLHLRLTYSPALIQELSHLRVSLNGQTLAALPLAKADAGHEVENSISLDPRYFTDYNHIQIDFVGHYTLGCEDPQHTSIWARISRASDLTLRLRSLELRDDLTLLPAPFFDLHDSSRLLLPILLPANPSRGLVRSAGVAASWFGVLADYRGARFPVSYDALPTRHALVFATNDARPARLALPQVQEPTVSVVDNPGDPALKLLVFQGRDETQLRQAVEGVVLGNAVLTGTSATVAAVSYSRRAPYDAPHWLRSDRAVRIGELVEDPMQLQGHGIAPPAILVNLRLPPDLFTWNRAGVPIDVHYRYTAPAERDNSVLAVSINNLLLRALRLTPRPEGGGRIFVPLLQNDEERESRDLLIPAFQLTADNQLAFQFAMDLHREGLCKDVVVDSARESIDPDSSIDISSFAHYAALPNLALFVNAGFPFTRHADLAETAIVLPETGDAASLEQLFFVLGRMGRQTGAAALAYRLLDTREALAAGDADLLVLSGAASNELLEHWGRNAALMFGKLGRDYRQLDPAPGSASAPPGPASSPDSATPRVLIRATGTLAALQGFESPLHGGRSVVALMGSDAAAARSLVAALEDDGEVALIRGELAVIRSDGVHSFQGSGLYYVGSLTWWQWLWFHFSRHAMLLIFLSLAVAVAAALLIYGGLQRVASRRLQGRTGA